MADATITVPDRLIEDIVRGEIVANLPVRLGKRDFVPIAVERELAVVVDRNTTATPKKMTVLPAKLSAPIRQGAVVGHIAVALNGKECGQVNLVAAGAVPRSGFWRTMGTVIAETVMSLFKRGGGG